MFGFGRKHNDAFLDEPHVVEATFSTDEEEVNNVEGQKHVEAIMEQLMERVFMTKSPNDGSLISAVRTTEIMDILCQHFGVNGKETSFSEYAS